MGTLLDWQGLFGSFSVEQIAYGLLGSILGFSKTEVFGLFPFLLVVFGIGGGF